MSDAAASPRPWLPRWRARHVQLALAVLAAAVVAALVLPTAVHPTLAAQVTILVVAVVIFGVPHGALDPLVGRTWLAPRLGPRWWAPFHGAYVLLAGSVVVCWFRFPAATLAGFLSASAVHFGLGDVASTRAPRGAAWAEVLVRGAAPITVPALAHPAAVRQAFGWVAAGAPGSALAAIVATSAWCARWLVVPGCAVFALAHLVAAYRAFHRARTRPPRLRAAGARRIAAVHLADALECVAVPAVAAAFPPFIAFLAYFCLLHSARHALALAAALDPVRPDRAWLHFARAALPATVATLAAGAIAWLALARAPDAALAAAVRVLFAGLAALTAPHMLLTAVAGEPTRPLPRPPSTC